MKTIQKETARYWNPILETMQQDNLKSLQMHKFKRIVAWAYHNSPFYHKLYKEAGLEPDDIKNFDDIRKVPKIEKGMMRDVQKNDPFPYGDMPRKGTRIVPCR